MFQERTQSFTEKYNPNDFVVDEGDNTSFFMNSWNQAKILENPDAEQTGMSELTSQARETLIKENPDKERAIKKYLYDDKADFKMGTSVIIESFSRVNNYLTQLQTDRFSRLFESGQIYMDESGQIVGNTDSAQTIVNDEQDDIKDYWQYRLLTDGTEFEVDALRQKNIAMQQDELIRLRQQARGADSVWDTVSSFAGTMAYVASEPENLLTMAGGTGNVGKGIAKNALQAVAKEAGLSVMVDAMLQPKILEWRRKLYKPSVGIEAYSTMDAINNTLLNATFSGLMQGTGSLVVDSATKLKYSGVTKAGTSKFDIIDANRASKHKFGTAKWRAERRDVLSKQTANTSPDGKPANKEVLDDAMDIASSSPVADLEVHANSINRSVENTENNIGFSDNDIHKQADVAQVNDFVAIKDGDGEPMLARVSGADDNYLLIDVGNDSPILVDRTSKRSGDDRWSVSETIESQRFIDEKVDVNQPDIEYQLSKRESAEAELVAVHSEDEEILHYNTSMDEIVQRGIDSGCFTMNQINGGQ